MSAPDFILTARRRDRTLLMLLGGALCALALLSLWLGSAPLALSDIAQVLFQPEQADPVLKQILWDFRLPRILTAILAGAALSTAGLLMQTLFRNPLADPFVLGVNSGASLGVALMLLLFIPLNVGWATRSLFGHSSTLVAACLGAGISLTFILILARRVDVLTLLVLGLMLSYAIGATVSIVLFFSQMEPLQSFIAWSFGDFSRVHWQQLILLGPILVLGLLLSTSIMKALDGLQQGETFAMGLGVAVKKTRLIALVVAALLAGSVTAFCGPIGFLGVAAPHLCRACFRSQQHRSLLPASILMGSLLALAADFVAQAPGWDGVLPLNALTALVGAPIIISALLRQNRRQHSFR
jgi:iron complex transport system permease protein